MENNLHVLLIFAFLYFIELAYLKIAKKFNIIDKPNLRSSHTTPTIRGGGIIFIIGCLLFSVSNNFCYPWLLLSVILSGLASFIDDVKGLPNKVRFGFHLLSIGLLLFESNLLLLTWWILPLFIIYVGITNAYNFMDGINGITGFYSLSILLPLLYTECNDLMLQFLVFMIMAIIVFLIFNARIKARCFAGDIGSISMALIILFIVTEKIISTGQIQLILTLLLYGLDSIFTIFQRLLNRENIFEAHRKHLYQYLANEYKIPHLLVSGMYGILQLLFNFWILLMHPTPLNTIISVLIFALIYVLFKRHLINHLNSIT